MANIIKRFAKAIANELIAPEPGLACGVVTQLTTHARSAVVRGGQRSRLNTKRIIITAPDVIKTATPTLMPSAKAKTKNTGDFFAPRARDTCDESNPLPVTTTSYTHFVVSRVKEKLKVWPSS